MASADLGAIALGIGAIACRVVRDSYFIAEQPAPAPHLAHPEGCAALRIVLVTVPRVSRSCEHFPDGFDLHLLHGLGRPWIRWLGHWSYYVGW